MHRIDNIDIKNKRVLIRADFNVPIIDGRMTLGTWQGLFVFEHRHAPHTRKVSVSVCGE